MADEGQAKTLGIYWGKKSLYLTESIGLDTQVVTNIPFSMKADGSDFSPFSSEGSDLVSNLSNAFKLHKIKPDHIYLSLPTKEIIFRSFVIPWMQQSEIADVVDFEASKYIPFSLEELSYSFHSMNINEGNTKRIRIIFAAIKKTTLDTFTALLEQANVSVTNVEPSPVSLIRCLVAQKFIPLDQTLAIIEKDGVVGKITIVDQGVPLFVREFHLNVPAKKDVKDVQPDKHAILTKLVNEMRISLDYFNRQETQLKVNSLILITNENEEDEIKTKLEIDLQIPTTPVSVKEIVKGTNNPAIDYLCAFGASYHDSLENHSKFDLVEYASNTKKSVEFDIKNIDLKTLNYKPIIITAVSCLCFFIALQLLKGFMIKRANQRVSQLEAKLGKESNKTAEMLENKTKIIQDKLNRYKSVRVSGDIAEFLEEIPKALPEKAWLNDLRCNYTSEKTNKKETPGESVYPIDVVLNGYVYTENLTEHISIITEFVRNLEKSELVNKFFERIRVESASQRKMGNYTVTYFKLDFIPNEFYSKTK